MLRPITDKSTFAWAKAITLGLAMVLVSCLGCKESPQVSSQRVPKSQTGLDHFRTDAASPESEGDSRFPTPDGWTRGKSNPMFPSDKFLKKFDGKEVTMSIMSLPASNDWISNIQRWQGQVGLGKSSEELEAMTTKVEVDGISSSRILLAKEDAETDAIIGIMSTKGELAWFIKLMGKKAAIELAEKEFNSYVGELKLP